MADDKTIQSDKTQETKPQAVSTPAPKKVDVVPMVTKPIEVNRPQPVPKKEVNELKDTKGIFDYSGCKTHVVKEGESLYDIAQENAVAMQQLRYFNHIPKDSFKIKAGQTLVIPKTPVNVPYGK